MSASESFPIRPHRRLGLGDVEAVVVGLDREVSYFKACVAQHHLRLRTSAGDHRVLFAATNPDAAFPMPHTLIPGAGSCVEMLAAAAERRPVV